jgi:hypothetical protein
MADYTTATATVMLTVNSKTIPTITWGTPPAITFGTALSGTQLDATASTPGTFVYTPAAGTIPSAGSDTLSVTFTPADTVNFATATAAVTLTVNKVTPVITWATPAPITAGTALSGTQLNATASVPGTFAYTPAAGTIPAFGTDTLAVVFMPTDTTDYANASATVSLTVNRGTPATITAVSGTSQSAHINLAFGTLMQVSVKDVANDPVPGVSVTFTAPASGASGTFAGGTVTASVQTDTTGTATAPAFTANGATGTYNVTASVPGVASPANFALTNTVAADYSIVANPSTVTIAQGQSGSTTFTLTPVGGFSGTVTLSCAGLPAFATCTFAPPSAVMNGSNTPVTVQLTVATSVATANVVRLDPPSPFGAPPVTQTSLLLLPGLLMALLAIFGFQSKRRAMPRFALPVLFLAAIAVTVTMTGCRSTANSASADTTPAGTYSATVTATASAGAGGASHSTAVTIIITQ